ncbi:MULTISPECIES: Crp/Fnr family transcriptional regulator [Flavobacterium]|jgi:CRP/FNR family transcriptional regulator, anaerobic regulatory protein|uniref:Cyclic nucleotide-binding protein n=1 Tax=Flavobacterium tructae TaxID=1114873 RepID=A0A1S1J546_9FLAO|nr:MULTISPECIES: Crp/Fnr family transcriptional regulator [Flavobacterium]MDL2143696.1 Crp/Fnr family transcriptional regulator [Flavobacterium tructae]OHT44306.1 cyclic nucleotide-binding protein [Flavobacterium tructae]OXB15924.1 cyclic nucleotide-binding protein [Flavobacterium tructae]URC12847.1 Crp/Fnr family transcriptional regulator [Flavobacterium sp. B183]
MYTALFAHIEKFVTLEASEIDLLESVLSLSNIKKKDHVLREGQVCNTLYFIVKGCMRQYIINSKGTEQTLQFGIESWWITDYLSYHNHVPSHFYIQAVENSEVIALEQSVLESVLIQVPKLERYFRIVSQKSFGAAQMRIKFLFTMSAEERYHHFNNLNPEFVQRVPQYMLASYLDFSAEFMSKIRAGKV